ncbi:MAG: hypothetical protein ACHQNA_04810, partial [Acidimicrobiales bacterium]
MTTPTPPPAASAGPPRSRSRWSVPGSTVLTIAVAGALVGPLLGGLAACGTRVGGSFGAPIAAS